MLYDDFLADPEVANKESLAALGRWIVEGGNYNDEFCLREKESGGRGGGRGGRGERGGRGGKGRRNGRGGGRVGHHRARRNGQVINIRS